MTECICKGNLQSIVKETHHLLDETFINDKCELFKFFGIVIGSDDYYYGMYRKETGGLVLLSCVGSLETHGFKLYKE